MLVLIVVAIGQVILAAIPALMVAGVAHLVGGDFDFWLVLCTATVVIPIDGIWRLAGVFDSEGEDGEAVAGGGVLNVVTPNGGGHLFFIPTWVVGGLAGVAICAGFLR
jgi:hypothetical protein